MEKQDPVKCLKQDIFSFPESGRPAAVSNCTELPAALSFSQTSPESHLVKNPRPTQVEGPSAGFQSNTLLQAGSTVSSDPVAQTSQVLGTSEDGDCTALVGNLFLNSRKFRRELESYNMGRRTWMFQASSQVTCIKSSLCQEPHNAGLSD